MNYPNFIDYKKSNDKYHFKLYDINIIERNCIYPFTYNTKNNVINKNDNMVKINHNNFIQLPNFENLMLDANGLPFIPLNI